MKRTVGRIGAIVILLCLFGVTVGAETKPRSIGPEALQTMLRQQAPVYLVNVMSPIECMDHSIAGSVCVPCEEFAVRAPILFKDRNRPLVIYCESNQCYRSCEAAAIAAKFGYAQVDVLKGGLPAWKRAGYPAVSRERIPRLPIPAVKPEKLEAWLAGTEDVLIVDLRAENRYREGHLQEAINLPLYQLERRYPEIPLDREVLLVDGYGSRSHLAACYLKGKGVDRVVRLFGGMNKWQAFQEHEKKGRKKR